MTEFMTKTWPDIVAHYDGYDGDWQSIRALGNLAREVSQGLLGPGLFAWTSMHDLCIVQKEVTYPYNGPFLRLSPVSNNEIEFRYIDTRIAAKQWHRMVKAEHAVPRLHKFLDELRWL
jgi:hypothetical protein